MNVPDSLKQGGRLLTDNGPLYTETDFSKFVVEPWNTATAALLIVGYWVFGDRSLRGRPFLQWAIVILTVGGVGGTLYHAFRTSEVFLVMDWLPILVLCMMACIYFFVKVLPKWWYTIPIMVGLFALQGLVRMSLPVHASITIGYAMMGGMILLPLGWYLARTRFANGHYVLLALASFGIALFFRNADLQQPPLLSMGTHWLWHLFGSFSCHLLLMFIWRVDNQTNMA